MFRMSPRIASIKCGTDETTRDGRARSELGKGKKRGMSDAALKEHIVMSYDLVVAGKSKKKRGELGLG